MKETIKTALIIGAVVVLLQKYVAPRLPG